MEQREPFLRSCQLCSYSRTSQYFMEPEGSLPCSQKPSTGPYSGPDESSPYHRNLSLSRSILILSTHLHLGLPSGLIPSGFLKNIKRCLRDHFAVCVSVFASVYPTYFFVFYAFRVVSKKIDSFFPRTSLYWTGYFFQRWILSKSFLVQCTQYYPGWMGNGFRRLNGDPR
jgi:hypothetical protein